VTVPVDAVQLIVNEPVVLVAGTLIDGGTVGAMPEVDSVRLPAAS
jgi:hypothetical protein